MSYNSQVETFVVGDLVCFTGYEVENPPLAHKIGIITKVGLGSKHYRLYDIYWIHSGSITAVNAKHLVLTYLK
jgi:hypothetical protein|tara:strand:- start:3405 stop:3623 length:219 start_codon:yes stop_codon:yes gene_type:complete